MSRSKPVNTVVAGYAIRDAIRLLLLKGSTQDAVAKLNEALFHLGMPGVGATLTVDFIGPAGEARR